MPSQDVRDQFLLACLDDVAARIRMRRGGRRFDLDSARRVLLTVISQDHGLFSFRLDASAPNLIRDYFDRRADFERVSDKPEWQPRAVRRAAQPSRDAVV